MKTGSFCTGQLCYQLSRLSCQCSLRSQLHALLQLLWLLTRQSWPGEAQTLVLDGQASEKADGLSHWLDKPAARLAALVSPDGLTPVISARLGLLTLCECARTEGAARARERRWIRSTRATGRSKSWHAPAGWRRDRGSRARRRAG